MNERLTLQDLVDLLSEKREMTKKDAELFLRELITLISETVEQNEPVRMKDFGTFKLVLISARKSVDVNTGEEIEIAPHYRLTFTPDKSLREAVNKPFAHFESVLVEDGVVFEDESSKEEELDTKQELSIDTNQIAVAGNERKVDPRLEAIFAPQKEEEEIDIATKRIGVVVDEIAASVTAFDSKAEMTAEDNRILDSMLLKQSSKETAQPETVAHVPAIEQQPIVAAEKAVAYNPTNEPPLYQTANDTKQGEKKQKRSIDDTISRILNDDEQYEYVENSPVGTTKGIETGKNEFIELIENQPQPNDVVENKTHENMEEKQEHDYDDNYYDEYPSSTKKYIYIGAGLLVVIGLIFGANYFLTSHQEVVTVDELVLDESDALLGDSTTLADQFGELDTTTVGIKPQTGTTATATTATSTKSTTDIGVETLVSGQTLRLIALKHYGHKSFWVYIYEVNKDKIQNPNNVALGTQLTIPSLAKFNVDPKDPKEIEKAKRKESELITRLAH